MNKLIVEFIGTFFLVQAVGYAALTKSALGALAVGLMLMVMVYAGGHISGANSNPNIANRPERYPGCEFNTCPKSSSEPVVISSIRIRPA